MKIFSGLGFALLTAGVLSTTAVSQSVGPADTQFTANGRISLARGNVRLNCNATFTGQTDANGGAMVTGVRFSGGVLNSCGAIKGRGLPWRLSADSTRAVSIGDVTAETPVGTCGPTTLAATFENATSTLRLNAAALAPNCSITGSLKATPNLVIAP